MLAAGTDDSGRPDRLTHAYRLGECGAVLVRPDGYVVWRREAAVADPVAVLADAVDTTVATARRPLMIATSSRGTSVSAGGHAVNLRSLTKDVITNGKGVAQSLVPGPRPR